VGSAIRVEVRVHEIRTAHAALGDETVRFRLSEASVEGRPGTSGDAAAFLPAEIVQWVPVAKSSGARVD
jgi:hypothetical protein